jgi:hypothetical protein
LIRKLLHMLEIILLRCKHCGYEWTESWRPSMAKENKPSPILGSNNLDSLS